MCELCAATEGTFREVGSTFGPLRAILGTPGDLVYVVRAGDCSADDRDDEAFSLDWRVEVLHQSCSEILTPNGLKYPLAKWVLDHTSPAADTRGQNV